MKTLKEGVVRQGKLVFRLIMLCGLILTLAGIAEAQGVVTSARKMRVDTLVSRTESLHVYVADTLEALYIMGVASDSSFTTVFVDSAIYVGLVASIGDSTGYGGLFVSTGDSLLYYKKPDGTTVLISPDTTASGITSLNGLSSAAQAFAIGTTGTTPGWSSVGSTHTLNIPYASVTDTGLITTGAQIIAGHKTLQDSLTIGQDAVAPGVLRLGNGTPGNEAARFRYDGSSEIFFQVPNTGGTLAVLADTAHVPQTHNQGASTITAGTFQAGTYTFQDNVTILDTLMVGEDAIIGGVLAVGNGTPGNEAAHVRFNGLSAQNIDLPDSSGTVALLEYLPSSTDTTHMVLAQNVASGALGQNVGEGNYSISDNLTVNGDLTVDSLKVTNVVSNLMPPTSYTYDIGAYFLPFRSLYAGRVVTDTLISGDHGDTLYFPTGSGTIATTSVLADTAAAIRGDFPAPGAGTSMPADSITAGTFQAGTYTFQDNVTIFDTLMVGEDAIIGGVLAVGNGTPGNEAAHVRFNGLSNRNIDLPDSSGTLALLEKLPTTWQDSVSVLRDSVDALRADIGGAAGITYSDTSTVIATHWHTDSLGSLVFSGSQPFDSISVVKSGTSTLWIGATGAADNGRIIITGNDDAFGYPGTMQAPTLTSVQTWTFPDSSGTIALLEYLPEAGSGIPYSDTTSVVAMQWELDNHTQPASRVTAGTFGTGAYTITNNGSLLHMQGTSGGGTDSISMRQTGESWSRWKVLSSGTMLFGPGTIAPDVNLYRSTTNRLKTDDDMDMLSLWINGTERATTAGAWTGSYAGTAITATYGGTSNSFFQVAGPTTSIKTYTFPDANAYVLTSADTANGVVITIYDTTEVITSRYYVDSLDWAQNDSIGVLRDSVDALRADIGGSVGITYSDTTSLIAMQWELDANNSTMLDSVGILRDSVDALRADIGGSEGISYSDTTSLIAMQWELDADKSALTDTASAIRGDFPDVSGLIPYTDTTSVVAMQWQVDADIAALVDTASGIRTNLDTKVEYADTTTLVAMQWELDADKAALNDTASNIRGAMVWKQDTASLKASTSATGFLSDLDWDTFNAKQAAISNLADTSKYLETTNVGSMAYADSVTFNVSLSRVTDLTGSKSFNMANNTLTWLFTNPTGGMDFNMTGAYTGDAVHMHQHTGNPGASDLLHLEADDADVVALRVRSADTAMVVTAADHGAPKFAVISTSGNVYTAGTVNGFTLRQGASLADTTKFVGKADSATYPGYATLTNLATKQATIANLADTSKYIEYTDTTSLIAMQWELDAKAATIPKKFVTITIDSSYINTTDSTLFLRAPAQMVLDSMHTVGIATAGMSVAIDVRYTTGLSTAGTAINTTPPTITGVDYGDTDTSFNNGTVPANGLVWVRFTTVTTKPKAIMLTLYYH